MQIALNQLPSTMPSIPLIGSTVATLLSNRPSARLKPPVRGWGRTDRPGSTLVLGWPNMPGESATKKGSVRSTSAQLSSLSLPFIIVEAVEEPGLHLLFSHVRSFVWPKPNGANSEGRRGGTSDTSAFRGCIWSQETQHGQGLPHLQAQPPRALAKVKPSKSAEVDLLKNPIHILRAVSKGHSFTDGNDKRT